MLWTAYHYIIPYFSHSVKSTDFLTNIIVCVANICNQTREQAVVLRPRAPSFTCDSEEEPRLFIRSRHSFSRSLLPSFLPNREPDQQQFQLDSDIQIFQSVFYVYNRFLERGKFDKRSVHYCHINRKRNCSYSPEKNRLSHCLSQRNSPISV